MALAALGLLGGCARGDGRAGPTVAATLGQAVDVVTAEAAVAPMSTSVEAVGTARARESVDVTSKTSNLITAIAFREGALVKAGEVLVELDGAEARAALAEAEAALLESEGQSRRSRNLYTQQALSTAQLEQIEATLQANRARVDAARARLADTSIRAGFDGRVGMRQVSVGSLINPGTVITTLDDASLIKLEFTIPESYLHLLRIGQAVSVRTAGQPDARYAGRITLLDSRVDPATRSIAVRAEIPNRDGTLRPGMFMTVVLDVDPSPALLVPEGAVVPEQGHTYMFVVANDKAQRREVRTGRRRKGEVEVVSGLAAGERVVVEGTQMLRDGDTVRMALAAAAGSGT
jgi:membrane fusion protein, multidrug efflux system